MHEAAKEFESMLTSMMLKSMTKTTGGLFGKENYGGEVLDVIFENEISKFITDSKSIGVAKQIYQNITGEKYPDDINLVSKSFNDHLKNRRISNSVENGKTYSNAFEKLKEYDDIISEAAEEFNIDPKLIKSVIITESAGNKNARSRADAKGLMQLMDSTATEMGVRNPWDPKENIFGGTKYLSKMLDDFEGDQNRALAAYNAGPGNVKKYGGIPPFKETTTYINRVNNYLNILE